MRETDLKAVPKLSQLAILDEDDAAARRLTVEFSAGEIAEAADTVRLFDLLHRDEYEAVAAVRFRKPGPEVRVYFRLLDHVK